MWSLNQWRAVGRRPLSARGHVIGLAFWLILAALLAYRLLTGDEDPGFMFFLMAMAVLANLALLLVSYRNTLRATISQSDPDGDDQGAIGAS